MPTEIEHKYLINLERFQKVIPEKSVEVKQAYLHSEPGKTIRVRTMGDKGFITIKGKTVNASRPEFEYEIPLEDANEMIAQFTTTRPSWVMPSRSAWWWPHTYCTGIPRKVR